jgi:hypothetical protein
METYYSWSILQRKQIAEKAACRESRLQLEHFAEEAACRESSLQRKQLANEDLLHLEHFEYTQINNVL